MYIKVHATANAKKERIEKQSPNVFNITVREPRERNLANRRIQELLARELGIKQSGVRLISGHRSASKIFDVALKINS
jgi:uncharacterized protein YggU (UPF0235/DUF167 family)